MPATEPWHHSIRWISDEEAECSICGPVGRPRPNGFNTYKGRKFRRWRCPNVIRRDGRRYVLPTVQREVCDKCGFKAEHAAQIERHHIDGDSLNNDPENIASLCANCHRLVTVVGGHYYTRKARLYAV